MREGYLAALEIVDTIIQRYALHDKRPNLLHHYTSVDAALKILKERDLWFCHCEYLNDTSEIHNSADLIRARLNLFLKGAINYRTEYQFYMDLAAGLDAQIKFYEAFVFCMSDGDINKGINSQDVLSSWRAYGTDGRGVCLTYESQHFLIVTQSLTGFRLSRVIYDEQIQIQIVDSIINEGYIKCSRANDRKEAVNGTVGALMFMMPAMKNAAFEEEKEWRVIYLPEDEDPKTSRRKFYVRRGLIIPYYSLWYPDDDKICPTPQVAEIMVGPSTHQALNLRSLEFHRGTAATKASRIPYRGD